MEYFSPMPTIFYEGRFVKNILVHVKPTDKFLSESQIFYPFSINEAEMGSSRMEDIAYDYYGNSDDVWILYHTNNVIDPYYDVYLNDRNFQAYMKKKYETIEASLQKYIFWRNNYYNDDSILSQGQYDTLNSIQKKFWKPTLGYNGEINGYIRHTDDFTYSTNKIITITGTSTQLFTKDEKITQTQSGGVATAYVIFSSDTKLKFQHIEGTVDFNDTDTITGSESNAVFTPTAETISTTNVIPEAEAIYYSPVRLYDYEYEQNESKKNLLIMDRRYQPLVHSSYLDLVGK